MKKVSLLLVGLVLLPAMPAVFAQAKQIRHERRPAATAAVDPTAPMQQPNYQYFSILDGTPKGLWLHHDTEVSTGKPIDVYVFAIELQVLNSDGNFEPVGLIIDNFTRRRQWIPPGLSILHNARAIARSGTSMS